MLDRASSPALLPSAELVSLRQGLAVGSAAGLFKFFGMLVFISGLTCLYLWQASTISTIEYDTTKLAAKSEMLEIENVDLMRQVQQWFAPAYVEGKAIERGMVPIQTQTFVELPVMNQPTATPEQNRREAAELLWHQATGWLHQPNQPMQSARIP
jgi:hypothetical protein